jgi:hypothetical protein
MTRACSRSIFPLPYPEARAGRLDWSSATKAAFILTTIARLIEGMELEQRVEALEHLAGEQRPRLPSPH